MQADQGLHHRIASLAMADRMLIFLGFLQQSQGLQFLDNGPPGLENARQPSYFPAAAVRLPSKPMTIDDFQAVPFPDFKVDRVMPRRNLEGAGAELHVQRIVTDDGNGTGPLWAGRPFSRHAPGSGDHPGGLPRRYRRAWTPGGLVATVMKTGEPPSPAGLQRVADVVQAAVGFRVLHLQVGQGGGAAGGTS